MEYSFVDEITTESMDMTLLGLSGFRLDDRAIELGGIPSLLPSAFVACSATALALEVLVCWAVYSRRN
jgi:hypothetical protein